MKPPGWRIVPALALVLLAQASGAGQVSVQNLRLWRAPDHTRLVFDLSAPLQHTLFTLRDPERIVVDMKGAVLAGRLPVVDPGAGRYLRGLRSGRPAAGTLRIVLDLKRRARARTFVLPPNDRYGHRLVIDLYDPAAAKPKVAAAARPRGHDRLVVAVDAGHGGEDFGAVGRHRTKEKDVVLAIARYLRDEIDRDPGMRALMIRKGDYYISLRRRIHIARRNHADLFVSIHADYFPQRRIRGASVYALSQRGATSAQAKILADKENAADLFGGVSINDKDDLLAKVLLDLSLTQTISDSLEFGKDILRALRRAGPIHIPRVEQAGFAVLKSPDIPSVLIETAFISNPRDEKRLRSARHQRRIARAIYEGIRRYAARGKIKPVTVARHHVVRKGDTLSEIAQRYRVSVAALKRANGLRGHLLRVGQRLVIPAGG